MSAVNAFAWIGIMLLIGMICRAKIPFLANILMPASVIGGIIGFILMNIGMGNIGGFDFNSCNQIVTLFFTLSFISIGLTSTPQEEGQKGQKKGSYSTSMVKGSLALGLWWGFLYCLTPLIGYACIKLFGIPFGMAGEYGAMIPFAFCQGPGQSATFGSQIEAGGAGLPDAIQVAVTYSVIGFLFAFAVGVPVAKYGLKKGLAAYPAKLDRGTIRGIYKPEDPKEDCGKQTTYSGNIDVLAFHLALVGLCYAITIAIQNFILSFGISILSTIAGMTFFIGLLVAYIVKWVMGKLNLLQYHDDVLQARITGATTDYLITGAFMAIQLTVISKWLVPILLMCTVVALVTFFFVFFFSPRIGGPCDFERSLGLWGAATGTCPSGVALIRIVDPGLRTTAAAEMGGMNLAMIPGTFLAVIIVEFCLGHMSLMTLIIAAVILMAVNIVLLLLTRNIKRKPTFSWRNGPITANSEAAAIDGENKTE